MNRPLRALVLCLASLLPFAVHGFQSPLNVASKAIPEPNMAPMFSVVKIGPRILAAGRYGVITYKDGASKEWRQARVPVSNDLVALSFGDARNGWAVGHGGVVLHSADGGVSWAKQLDGKLAGDLASEYYQKNAASLSSEQRESILSQADRMAKEGTTQPFLDVWFKDKSTGFIVGTFNRIFRTDDGGNKWTPLIEKINNPQELHFYAVRGNDSEIYIAGEAGSVWRWDEPKAQFILVPTPYNGSLFGLVVTPRAVLAYGMRGRLYRTLDRGANWEKITTGLTGGIVAGDVRANGEIALVNQSGEIITSTDDGATFKPVAGVPAIPVASIITLPGGAYMTAGPTGVRVEDPTIRVSKSR